MPCFDANYAWQSFGDPPEHERVMVLGWQLPTNSVKGYWWYEEDVICEGRAFSHPTALYWCPLIMPPFPAQEHSTPKPEYVRSLARPEPQKPFTCPKCGGSTPVLADGVCNRCFARGMSAGTAKTAQPVEGDSPPARSGTDAPQQPISTKGAPASLTNGA